MEGVRMGVIKKKKSRSAIDKGSQRGLSIGPLTKM